MEQMESGNLETLIPRMADIKKVTRYQVGDQEYPTREEAEAALPGVEKAKLRAQARQERHNKAKTQFGLPQHMADKFIAVLKNHPTEVQALLDEIKSENNG